MFWTCTAPQKADLPYGGGDTCTVVLVQRSYGGVGCRSHTVVKGEVVWCGARPYGGCWVGCMVVVRTVEPSRLYGEGVVRWCGDAVTVQGEVVRCHAEGVAVLWTWSEGTNVWYGGSMDYLRWFKG